MTAGGALIVIVVGLLIAALLHPTIGMIVTVVGVIALILALVSGGRTRTVV